MARTTNSQLVNLELTGLELHANNLSQVPRGGLQVADNVVLRRESLLETRRGFAVYNDPETFTLPVDVITTYRDTLLTFAESSLYKDDGAGGWTIVDALAVAPDADNGFTNQALTAKGNLYYTTDEEVRKLDSISATPVTAGVPEALDIITALSGTSGFMADDTAIAYRIVWGIIDANDNLILGAPSQRVVVTNSSGGTRDVDLQFYIPAGITTSHFYQIYRSLPSASATDTPDDELQLVIEGIPSGTDITNGYVIVEDNVPDTLLGADLYTNANQEGILQANSVPPQAKVIAQFRQHVFYGNTQQPTVADMQLISVGGTAGIQTGDTVTIAGEVYTAGTDFTVSTGGTPGQNIEDTARALVNAINIDASNTQVYAFYNLDPNAIPGQITIRNRDASDTDIVVTSSRTTCWLQGDSFPRTFTVERSPNRIYISKFSEPEAVPSLNFIDVGDEDDEITAMVASRDHLFIFKNDGIFRLTGEIVSSFRVDPHDNTAKLLAPRSARLLNNQIYCLTDQGVASVSNVGVSIVSRSIEKELLRVTASQFDVKKLGFATSYESEREYAIFVQTDDTDTSATQAYVYNTFTRGWVRWTGNWTCGRVSPIDDKMYLGGTSLNDDVVIFQERKSLTPLDYADEQFAVTIDSFLGTTVTLDSTANVEVGYTLKQDTQAALITEILSATDVVIELERSWDVTGGQPQAYVYVPINQLIVHVPEDGENPGMLKRWNEATLFFDDAIFAVGYVGFQSNFSVEFFEVPASPRLLASEAAWGLFPWDGLPWGGALPEGYKQPIRVMWSNEARISPWVNIQFRLSQAFTSMAYGGYSVTFKDLSTRMRG